MVLTLIPNPNSLPQSLTLIPNQVRLTFIFFINVSWLNGLWLIDSVTTVHSNTWQSTIWFHSYEFNSHDCRLHFFDVFHIINTPCIIHFLSQDFGQVSDFRSYLPNLVYVREYLTTLTIWKIDRKIFDNPVSIKEV